MSEIRRPIIAGRCFIIDHYCRQMAGIGVDVESFVVALSVCMHNGSVREV